MESNYYHVRVLKWSVLLLIGLIHFSFLKAQQIDCDNLGFVNGDLSDWEFYTGCHPNAQNRNNNKFCHMGGNAECCPQPGRVQQGDNATIWRDGARHTVVGGVGTNYTDYFTGFNLVPKPIPGYAESNYALRLGNAIRFGEAEMVERTFEVTNDNAIFAYQFAFVLNDPLTGHKDFPVNNAPYYGLPFFEAGIYDGEEEIDCSHFVILADDSTLMQIDSVGVDTPNCEFVPPPCPKMTVRYKPWTPVFFDLTDHIGERLTIRFKNSDCALSGHWGYSYVSAFCGPYEPLQDTTICTSEEVTLKSPFPILGFELEWYNTTTGELIDTTEVIKVTPGETTTYKLVVKNKAPFDKISNDCEKEYEVTIHVGDAEPPTLVDDTICAGQAVTLTASPQGITYNWYDAPTGGNLIHEGDQYDTPPLYNDVTYYVMNPSECAPDDRIPVNVVVRDASADAGPDTTICVGGEVQLNATGGVVYNWSPPDGLSQTNIPDPIATPQTTTTYVVRVTDDLGICEATDSITIAVEELQPAISGTNVCINEITEFANSTSPSNLTSAQWDWDFGDGTTSTEKQPSHVYAAPGTYNVVLQVDGGVCKGQGETIVEVYPNPVAEFVPNPKKATIDNPVINFEDLSRDAVRGTWYFGDGEEEAYLAGNNPKHAYFASNGETGPFKYNIQLFVISEYGCTDSVSHAIEIDNLWTIYIPNSFTPNGDGVNDLFKAYGVGILEFNMTIYDRWGEVVFRTDNIEEGWDGTPISGDAVKQDVYVWKVRVMNNKKEVHKYVGHVSLFY